MMTALPRLFHLSERVKRSVFEAEDRLFEARHGLDLARPVPHDELVADDPAALAHATSYMGVWLRNVRVLMREARRANPALEAFVDIGSGKGKACFYAALNGRYRSVLGVELSAPLVAVAEGNRRRFPHGSIRFECADASRYQLPDTACLVFLFNPFDGVVLERFVAHNALHFRRHRSLVGYANDVHRDVLRQQAFDTVYRDPLRRLSLHEFSRR